MTGRWPVAIRLLHWLSLLLVVVAIPTIYAAIALTETDTDTAETLASVHMLCGLTLLALTLLRFGLRLALPAPPLLPARAGLRRATALVTVLLYLLLVALPVTGILKLTLSGLDVTVFGLVLVPSLWRAPDLARFLNRAHEWLAMVLIGLVLLHAAAALLHRRITGLPVMRRMAFGADEP